MILSRGRVAYLNKSLLPLTSLQKRIKNFQNSQLIQNGLKYTEERNQTTFTFPIYK
jgi:hypothetical protein